MESAPISVVIRVRDEAEALGRCLALLAAQHIDAPVQVIVVDHASTDASAAVAAHHGAQVIGIAEREFSFGRALNRGSAQAAGEIAVALSAHAFPPDRGWLARLAAAFEDPVLACACGERYRPDGSPLSTPLRYDAALAELQPRWGYSNAAGGFRVSLWRERPFREDLPGCEDKEWGRYWALRGRPCLLDPGLVVDHDHTHDPVGSIYRRARREAAGFAMYLDEPPPSVGRLARIWWSDTRFYAHPWRARLSHRRAARLLGSYAGARATRAR